MGCGEFGDGPPGFRGEEAKRGGLGYQMRKRVMGLGATAQAGVLVREVRQGPELASMERTR